MKRLQALIAAAIVTGLIGLGMLAIGVNAALNTNVVAASNAPGDPPAAVASTTPQAQAQISQLEGLIKQYQNREQQYQAQLNQATTQLEQANTQLQQYQQLLVELQRRGLIRIGSDGSIQVPRRGFLGGDDNGG
jgi:septal ring factor EnvC (AmiA/AmiB activator)